MVNRKQRSPNLQVLLFNGSEDPYYMFWLIGLTITGVKVNDKLSRSVAICLIDFDTNYL